MWGGLTGKRRKNGLFGMLISIVIGSILLYLSFYISFLYLLIPVLLIVVFHYTKLWRFSDRTFYGFLAIIIAFFIAMGGISTSLTGAPHESTAAVTVASSTYDVHFSYYNNSGNYLFNFSLPANNVMNEGQIALNDLFTNKTIISTNITLNASGTNYSYSWNAGHLSPEAYVVFLTFHVKHNNSTVSQGVPFLGPVLIPSITVIFLLAESLIGSYLLITFLFFLAFAFFARAITNSRQKRAKKDEQPEQPGTGGSDQFPKR
jgi:hypothetical protein